LIEVSVILPAKNEEATIGICIQKIRKVFDDNGIVGEIIVADNSQDKTPVIAKDLGAKVVTPDKYGYGYAYRYAFQYASGKYIIIADADDTYDFIEIPKLLATLKSGTDVVIGSRLKGKIDKGAMPWHHRWIGNPTLTGFLNTFFKAKISDAHSGFRAITKEALDKLDLETDGMEFASEMIIEAIKKGLVINEVPITYHKRKIEASKLSSFSDGWRHMKFLLTRSPTHLFIYPGLFFLLVGIFLMVSALFKINISFTPGSHSMVAGSLLTTTGYQIILFGFFARVYEGKYLPKYMTLEKGATIGALIFLTGIAFELTLIYQMMSSGFQFLPLIEQDIFGYSLIIIGIQTFFSSFVLSTFRVRKSAYGLRKRKE
jgi:glycosyltransferase involved in cell wall biosynthesis